MNKLLLVIDVQKDFINENTYPILSKIENLIIQKDYKYVVFTKFINDVNSIWYKDLNIDSDRLKHFISVERWFKSVNLNT